jgi:acetate CoA/acetoacetate CoA-transferase alpha subunit
MFKEVNVKSKRITKQEFQHLLFDGATIMIGGFMNVGAPALLIRWLSESNVQDLTLIANDAGYEDVGLGLLIKTGKIRRLIASHIGLNPHVGSLMTQNALEVTLVPQGTLAEQIRCGGAGLGGVLTPTGVGTTVENDKITLELHGEKYIVETALKADFAFIFAAQGDEKGNLMYHRTAQNFNPLMAMAGNVVFAEVGNIHTVGSLNPDHIVTQHIFIDYIVSEAV